MEEWFFSVVDVAQVLTGSTDPKQYIKKLRSRDPQLNAKWGTICTPVAMTALAGKRRKIQTASLYCSSSGITLPLSVLQAVFRPLLS